MVDVLSADQLTAKYPYDEYLNPLLQLMDIRAILSDCIIASDYRVSREMYEKIILTPYGDRVLESLKSKVPYPEARVLCLLELLHLDLLVDPIKSDMAGLLEEISGQIKSRAILLPYTSGRLLYDKAYRVAPKDNYYSMMTEKETAELLSETPQGVFQIGKLVTGPFGILQSQSSRVEFPSRHVCYHCADKSCPAIHKCWLSTAEKPPINAHRDKIQKQLEKESTQPSAWDEYFRFSPRRSLGGRSDLKGDPLVSVLGDVFNLEELRLILSWLLDNTRGIVRRTAGYCQLAGSSGQIAASLDAASCHQLILTASDRDLIGAIDSLIADKEIVVTQGEIRRGVLNDETFGIYDTRAEIGEYGVRLVSTRPGLAVLRLRRLVERMYRLDDENDRQELEWQLRGEDIDSIDAKIEQFLRNRSPREAVATLLLARRANMIVAAEELSLHESILTNDAARVNAVLWKLGFQIDDDSAIHRSFWRKHGSLTHVLRQGIATQISIARDDKVRAEASSYFVQLESVLQDSLFFTTWALLSDHFAESTKFVYRVSEGERFSRQRLSSFSTTLVDDPVHQVDFDDLLTLYPLARGFQILADGLCSLRNNPDQSLRPEREQPSWARRDSLERFPFVHLVPFLDLLPDSQELIVTRLKRVAQSLISTDANGARNEWMHGNRNPDVARLEACLDGIQSAVSMLEHSGFTRKIFRRTRSEIDEARRSKIYMSDAAGTELALMRPSQFSFLGLPNSTAPQHVMICAKFAEPFEVLRFVSENDSSYARIWRDYPLRRGSITAQITAADSVIGR
ncbi:hypothetical protein AB0I55_24680 [Actinocatenispora sera]|uniref:hypothetical protein n=1 Tax=Actinocatenispora sera TaxID=390989 RepID=UPI0034058616